jgi:NAD(P)-dependent dehydrogenase (short-subunit alcohol dehydrogenase family)
MLEVDDASLNFSYLGTLKILNRLKDKVAIITGGASGMGRASSSLFAAEGAKVAIVDRNETMGKTIESEIGALGHEAFFVKADLSQLNEVKEIVPKVLEQYGKVDILFGNAGVNILKRTEDTDEADWESMFNTNLRGHFFLTKAVVPAMRKNSNGGVILFTSSTSAISGEEDQVAYSATKGGIISMVTAMAKDLGHYRIRVNCILPGSVDTPLFRVWLNSRPNQENALAEIIDEHIIKRLGTPEDIAKAALFLCSDDASWITGSAYRVDGGYLVRH